MSHAEDLSAGERLILILIFLIHIAINKREIRAYDIQIAKFLEAF